MKNKWIYPIAFLLPCIANAQIVVQGEGGSMGAIGSAMEKGFLEQMSRVAMFTPKVVTIDPKTRTATFEIENVGDDTLDVDLKMSTMSLEAAQRAQTDTAASLLVDTAASSASPSAPASSPSLVEWTTIIPKKIQLLPHTKRTVTAHADVPNGTASGEYTGWVLASTTARVTKKTNQGGGGISFGSANGEAPAPLLSGAQLFYKL